jgi:hypothetical protein
MTIPPDLEAQILRYYHVEKWRVGTIARQLHVHHVWRGSWPRLACPGSGRRRVARGSSPICPLSIRPWRSSRR